MAFIKDLSIRIKFLLLLSTTAVLALLLVFFALMINTRLSARKSLGQELCFIADVVAKNSGTALNSRNEQAALESLISLSAKPEIVMAVLYDKSGSLFCKFVQPGVDPNLLIEDLDKAYPDKQVLAETRLSPNGATHFLGDYVHVIRPVSVNKQIIGTIHLVDNMKQVKSKLSNYYWVVLFVVCVTLIIIMLLSAKMQKIFVKPLFGLMKTINEVSTQKNYTVRVKKHSNDEFGILIDHFNSMIEEIQE
ncbi:MAG: HAMP domain-containing protein, partial [Desulfobacteraceae bacterium]|nr:HAMP domain-containing protein [Desulfobacteraceae bacterium]